MREKVIRYKEERDAVILAHNYQLPEVQAVADFVGDSLELAIRAKETEKPVIVFCGVDFMAETAKILNPEKKVIMPVKEATCPLARQLTPGMIREARRIHPDSAVVVYVNSTAECKAEADIVCTSANAVNVVRSLPQRTVIFGPDANLAAYVQKQLPDRKIVPLPATGHCYVHTYFSPRDVEAARRSGGLVICHPECSMEVQEASDKVASTGGMVRSAPEGEKWHVLTERDMAHRLRTLYPDRTFVEAPGALCHDMKLTTLDALLHALRTGEYEVTLKKDVMDRAREAIERMIAIRR